jgi:hypothetical protein
VLVEDLSMASRVDGAPGAGSVHHGRKRDNPSKPKPVSPLEEIVCLAKFAPLWELAAEFETLRDGPGRPLETSPFCVCLIEAMTWGQRSIRRAMEFLDPVIWAYLRKEVEYAWPDQPERRLPERPISRDQYFYFKRTRVEFDDVIARVRAVCREVAVEVAHEIGVGDPSAGSVTHPATCQMAAGDATHIRCMTNTSKEDAIDKVTGEWLTRRFDPDGYKYHDGGQKTGHTMVSVIGRTKGSNERVIFDLGLLPRGVGDATMFTDMALELFEAMPGLRGATYDMAMHPRDFDRILAAGRVPVTKTQLTKTGQRVALNLGEHIFRTPGRADAPLVVVAIDGTPCVTLPTPDGPKEVQLQRRQTKVRRLADGSHTVGGFWRIPDLPEVPKARRGMEVWIHHNSTADEIARKKPRTRALRVIPKGDPDFDASFGVREDTESMHNHMKRSLINGRARGLGRHRVLFNLHAYQMVTNMTALLAHHADNPAALERWFGRSRPPGELRLAA